jgi:ABC-2 type transport system ATP-binding protein
MTDPIVCRDVAKKFRGVCAVEHFNLTVPDGAIYGLVGPNGAGKTTAIRTIVNIYSPDSGTVKVLGTDSRRLGPRDLARIGYVSENQELPGWMTVNEFLQYLRPFYPRWDNGLAGQLLAQFSLPASRKLKQISRGMRMKAALLSSLAYRPNLLVLDEPFTGLDAATREEVIEGFVERASEMTVLISSHDLTEIESFCSHIGYISHGRLEFSEDMTALASRFRLIEITLDAPPAVPAVWPPSWIRPEMSPALVRFVESNFSRENTIGQIHRLFSGVRNISASPMALRDIFVALARSRPRAA